MTDVSKVEIPVVNKDAKPLTRQDFKIMANIVDL